MVRCGERKESSLSDPLLDIDIDPDIRRASTLPKEVYTAPAVFETARERVFARSWQFIGDGDLVKVPGQVQPLTLMEGTLDEPVLLTRAQDDKVYCLSNVCTHRGNLLCTGAGREKSLVCGYHGRRFELDGFCRHMPEFEQVTGFPGPKDHLSRIPFASWSRFLFASPAPAAAFERVAADMVARVGWLPLDRFVPDAAMARDYLVRANWALYCDNYLEGFHIPFVHASLNKALDYGSYRTELFEWSSLQLGIAAHGEDAFDLPKSSSDYGLNVAAYYFWLFPNTMFNFYPWGLSINVVRPLGPSLTKVSFIPYLLDASKLERGAGAGLDRVEREDESVVEAVQRGLRSRHYERGRYSPTREQGVHHFHRLLARALGTP
ncbi:MAG: Rieske 2Fe-2S domain-containing protein [Phycisphaerae bacterium]|nr:Rieske 2Fe-2S domain-containing protein [Phycisphaerae bacterium]